MDFDSIRQLSDSLRNNTTSAHGITGSEGIPVAALVEAVSAAYDLALALDCAVGRYCLDLGIPRPVPRLSERDPDAGGGRLREDYLRAVSNSVESVLGERLTQRIRESEGATFLVVNGDNVARS